MMGSAPAMGRRASDRSGLYQFTPLQYACLSSCRNPLFFLVSEWRDGALGGFVMVRRHGAYCVGCCWALMGLLFVLGVMNLAWISLLAALCSLKNLPAAALGPVGVWVCC